jgi:hypothetical protein
MLVLFLAADKEGFRYFNKVSLPLLYSYLPSYSHCGAQILSCSEMVRLRATSSREGGRALVSISGIQVCAPPPVLSFSPEGYHELSALFVQ